MKTCHFFKLLPGCRGVFDRTFTAQRQLYLILARKMAFNYPKPRRDESVVDIIHGKSIKDPYRWMEDPNSEEVHNYIHEQNRRTNSYLASYPLKEKIFNRVEELVDYPRYGCPRKDGSNYFFRKNSGLQNQYVLYIQDSLEAEPKVFIDPNELDKDGLIGLVSSVASEDGKFLSYALCHSGSDWRTIKVKKVPSGEDTEDKVEFAKYTGISWTHDNKGFFYSRFPEDGTKNDGSENDQMIDHKVYYHRIGTPQSEDVLVVEFPKNPFWKCHGFVSDCGKFFFASVSEDTKNNAIYYAPLDKPITGKFELLPLVDKFEASYSYITNDGKTVYCLTNRGASNYKMIKIDLDNPAETNWVEVIPEHETNVLKDLVCVDNDKLITVYTQDVCDIIQIRELQSGKLIFSPELPLGTIANVSGKRKDSEVFVHFCNFLTPGIIYRMDMTKRYEISVFRKIEPKGFNCDEFITNQVFYKSKDGVKIPMFIVHSKDFKKDGTSPALLYGYGGFNIPIQPYYTPDRTMWLKNFKGVFAVANIRGGGEYGEKWHNAGRLSNKPNTFQDFIQAGQFLIEEGYCHKNKLTIEGHSNGGLTIAASSNLAPHLFACAICHVGVLDMTRYHKFGIGLCWKADFGDPEEKEDFENLIKYSPLHNIPTESTVYPAILILTGDHDDRVSPLHSLKYAAELQYSLKVSTPIMLRVDCDAGHGANKSIKKKNKELADVYCFIAKSLDLNYIE